MKTLEALYFPGTEIYSGSQFPVFLLFRSLHLLQPVEPLETADNVADIFITAGLCQAHTPCPLGKDRDRFLRLIRDLRERKDDYAAQLSSLTVASLSAPKPSSDDTEQGIISSLLGRHGVVRQPGENSDELLWQARLVLKIGEILDREEEEVAMHMALLDDEQESIFKTLQGETEDEEESLFNELKLIKEKISRPTAGAIKNRLTAWNRLHLADQAAAPHIWLTHMVEAADILQEKYENRTKAPASILAEFELPANIGWSGEEALDRIRLFRENNSELLREIEEAFSAFSVDQLQSLAKRWQPAIDTAFPASDTGRTPITFYNFSGQPCARLLGGNEDSGKILAVVRWLE